MKSTKTMHQVGLGLRRELLTALQTEKAQVVDFLEVAPENWIGIGGKLKKQFCALMERYPLFCHGLSLSLGGPSPLNLKFLKQIKSFLDEYQVEIYSEHLSYCGDEGYLYDLLPIPFTEEAVRYVSGRIKQAQEILERPIAIENVSYYVSAPLHEMDEGSFVTAVLKEANCELLLDVNNVYVNSINHGYSPEEFLKKLPAERIRYLHIAGHYQEEKDLIIDTHGADVIDPVWHLLEEVYQSFGDLPTLLERDFNIPPLSELLAEIKRISFLQEKSRKNLYAPHLRSASRF